MPRPHPSPRRRPPRPFLAGAALSVVCGFGQNPGIEFVSLPPGQFQMGCSGSPDDCGPDERPAHPVSIASAFEIGKYEVTQAQWTAVMDGNPSHFQAPGLPVGNISWHAAQEFLARLNRADNSYWYRLPTEAEWEYAARAGGAGPSGGELPAVAWYGANSEGRPHPVGTKLSNRWGLHDMLGNVWEWCADWYGSDYYAESPEADPRGPATGAKRVLRGGSWYRYVWFLRPSARFRARPGARYRHVGMRCARTRR